MRLREWRERRDWSQAELARRVTALGHQMGKDAMSKLEARQRDVKLDDAIALAAALGVPLAALLLGDEREEVELTPKLRVRTPFVNGWLAGRMPLDPADAEIYAEATDALNAFGGPGLVFLAARRDLNERERKMTEAVIKTILGEADDFERVATRLDPEQAKVMRESAQDRHETAASLEALLREDS